MEPSNERHVPTVKHCNKWNQHSDLKNQWKDLKLLPFEDTLWLIDESVEETGDEDVQILVVRDKLNVVIGSCCLTDECINKQSMQLLCECMLSPLTGIARRPLKVIYKNPRPGADLDLSDIGVSFMCNDIDRRVDHSRIQMRNCAACRLRGSAGLFRKCASCRAVLYCSKECQTNDWCLDGQMTSCSHKLWCSKMAEYMAKTDELNNLPFTFTSETTSPTFTERKYVEFLRSHGVYEQGGWRREIIQPGPQVPFGELPEDEDLVVLPVESTVLDDAVCSLLDLEFSWVFYYKCRGFRLDSPVAILMQWPLTVFYIIKHCLPNDYPAWSDRFDGRNLIIDIVGVEKEVDILPIFKELGHLMNEVIIDVQMYGCEISRKVNGKVYEYNNLKIKVVRGHYHKTSTTARTPHVVIGFNAGLGAYKQWSQTLVKLRTQSVPAYFTDYCQYSCECSRLAVEGLALGTISQPVINPFRSPVRKLSSENELPWYSNGFLYHLKYPP